jgi:hypothetical protein
MRTSKKKSEPRTSNGQTDPDSEFKRFERLTKRLVSVPKKEIEKQAKKKAG